jgi:hypothetical protein
MARGSRRLQVGRGQVQLTRDDGRRVDLVAVPRTTESYQRTPSAMLAALEAQVTARRNARIDESVATEDRVRLVWTEGSSRRRHWAVFAFDTVVHVSCVDVPPSDCDAFADSARAEPTSVEPGTTPTATSKPIYAVMEPATPPATGAGKHPPTPTRMSAYADGLRHRAVLVDAERASGMELRP